MVSILNVLPTYFLRCHQHWNIRVAQQVRHCYRWSQLRPWITCFVPWTPGPHLARTKAQLSRSLKWRVTPMPYRNLQKIYWRYVPGGRCLEVLICWNQNLHCWQHVFFFSPPHPHLFFFKFVELCIMVPWRALIQCVGWGFQVPRSCGTLNI